MDKLELINFLDKHHSRKDMLDLTDQVRNGTINIRDVFELTFDDRKKIAFRAAWFLESVVATCLGRFTPIAKDFLANYHLQKNLSARRHFSKIAYTMLGGLWLHVYNLRYEDFKNCVETSFDWLLDYKTPVAVQCNCIDIIYKLSGNEDWILEELMPILERNLISTSPALLSRTKAILEKHQKRINELK